MSRTAHPAQLFSRPYLLCGTLLMIICLAETVTMYLLPVLFPEFPDPHPYPALNLADALLMTALSAPFFWLLVVRPLCTQALNESAHKEAVLGSIVDAVIQFDAEGRVESINDAAISLFGYARQEIIACPVELIVPDLRLSLVQARRPGPLGGEEPCDVLAGRRKDGSMIQVECSVSRVELSGRPTALAILHDVTRRQQLASLVEEQREFLENLVQQSAVATFVLDPGHRLVIWNRACEELTGVPADRMLAGNEPWRAFYPEKHQLLANLVITVAHGGPLDLQEEGQRFVRRSCLIPEGLESEGWYRGLNGKDRYLAFNAAPIRSARGELLAAIQTMEDLTDRKRYQEQLEFQSNYDGLTGLPNRNLLADRIRQMLLLSRRNCHEVAVFVLDLDNFRLINDTLGQDAGDAVLRSLGERMSCCMRSGDTVAHQGGDEFTVVVSEPGLSGRAGAIAEKILETVSRPLEVGGHELVVTASLGISIFPRDGSDMQTLFKNAEIAMYRAKELGRGAIRFYLGEMDTRSLAQVNQAQLLRRAVQNEELELYYQPKASLRTGRITGMEALVRWHSPELGTVSPSSFIPLAEETGLIVPLGTWVLRRACAQNRAWQDAGLPVLPVAVNLSPAQFAQLDIGPVIAGALAESGLEARYLELEITEGMVMRDVARSSAVLAELKDMGVSLSMDDFGTGYSSLSYLKRFPFDKLKIDQSFVREITVDPDNAAIARAVIAMAHSLHLKVIAEGVETPGQLAYLSTHGCDEMQGYHFSRPLPAGELESLLRDARMLTLTNGEGQSADDTLLVVDDEERVTQALERLLLLEGYRVITANSGAQGLELLALNRVAVILSDFRMPGMNGAEFLGRAKMLHPSTVRLVLSGHADLSAVTDAVNVGAIFKILSKPWQDDEIREQVGEAFNHYRRLYGVAAQVAARLP